MIRVKNRLALAVAAVLATVATVFVAQPAQAAASHSSGGASRITGMTVSRDYLGAASSTPTSSVSVPLPAAATSLTMTVKITFPYDFVDAHLNETWSYNLNQVVPAGVSVITTNPTAAGQVKLTTMSDDYALVVNATAKTIKFADHGDTSDPSVTFTVSNGGKTPTAGTYSLAPALTNPSGSAVGFAATDNDIYTNPSVSQKSFLFASDSSAAIPAGAVAQVTVDTCVLTYDPMLLPQPSNLSATLSVDNADVVIDGTVSKWYQRPTTLLGSLATSNTYSNNRRAHAVVTVNNGAGVSEKTPNVDLAVWSSDLPMGSDNLSAPCVPNTPAKPSLNISSSNGAVTFNFSAPTPSSTDIANSYDVSLLDATSHALVASANVLKSAMSLSSGTYYASTVNLKQLDGSTAFTPTPQAAYTLKIRAKATNSTEVYQSAYSAESDAKTYYKPFTPNKPTVTLASITGKSVTVTFPITTVGDTYFAAAWKASDTGYVTMLGQSDLTSCTVTGSTVTCVVSATSPNSFLKPDTYVVRVRAINPVYYSNSDWSPASTSFEGAAPGVTVATPDSSWTRGGKATIATSTDAPPTTSSSATKTVSDGLANMYVTSTGAASAGNFPITMKKMNFDGVIDSSFGGSGSVSFNIPSTTTGTAVGLFGSGQYAYVSRTGSPASSGFMGMSTPSSLAWSYREGTLGSAPGAAVVITSKLTSVCNGSWAKPMGFNLADAMLSNLISAPTARPVAVVTCVDAMNSKRFDVLASVASDGTLTQIWDLNPVWGGGASTNYSFDSFSVNPNATGTDIAIVASSQQASYSSEVYSNRTQRLIRVSVDGVGFASTVATPFTQAVELAPFNDGLTVPGILGTPISSPISPMGEISQPALKTDLKVTVLNGVTVGNFNTPVTLALDSATPMTSASTLSFPFNAKVTASDGSMYVNRSETVGSSETTAAAVMSSTGVFKTGQVATFDRNGDAFELRWIKGSLQKWMYVPPVVAPATASTSILTWALLGIVTEVIPAYSSKNVDFVLNAGAPLTIYGTDFTLTSTTKNVKGVKFGSGGTLITPTSKTATSLVVQIPVNTQAASTSAPRQVDVLIVLGDNTTVAAGSIRYIGATKAKQTVTGFMTINQTLTTDTTDYQYGATVTNNLTGASNLAQTVTASPATVCSLKPGFMVHFEGMAGVCTIKNVVASNAYMDGATDSWTITVRATDTITALTTNGYDGTRGFIPSISTASNRGYTLAIASGSSTVCETPTVNSSTKLVGTVYLKATRPVGATTCDIVVTTPSATTTWTSETKTVSIPILSAAGETLAKAIDVTSSSSASVKTPWRDVRLNWNSVTGDLKMGLLSTFVGPVTATLKFKDTSNVAQSCVLSFGTLAAVPAAQVTALKVHQSGSFCSGATLTKFKAKVTQSGAAGTPVTLDIVFKKYDPANYTLKSTDTYPTLYFTLK